MTCASVRAVRGSLLAIVLLFCVSCASLGVRPGGMHVVRRGETLAQIAQSYQVSPQAIAEWNNIQSSSDALAEGRRIYVPAGKRTKVSAKTAKRWDTGGAPIKTYHGTFAWPVDGPVNSQFGMRSGNRHDGLDIGGKMGDPIRAAAPGTVVFEGKMSGYGNLIIVRHGNGYYTAYAHNSSHEVKKGDQVKQGKVIAKLGATGHATGPHLHFEVRDGQSARNPLFFLPPRNEHERAVYAQGRGLRKAGTPAVAVASAPPTAATSQGTRAAAERPAALKTPTASRPPPARAAQASVGPASQWRKFTPRAKKSAPIHNQFRANALQKGR